MKKEKSKAKQMYIEKGGNKYKLAVSIFSTIFGVSLLCYVLVYIFFPETMQISKTMMIVLLGSCIFTYLLIILVCKLYVPKTIFKEFEYNGNHIAAFINKDEQDELKMYLTLCVNDNIVEKDFGKFVKYNSMMKGVGGGTDGGNIVGILLIISLSCETYFYTKAKKQEIAEGKHIVRVSQVVEGQVITAEYHRFKHKLKIYANDKEIKSMV